MTRIYSIVFISSPKRLITQFGFSICLLLFGTVTQAQQPLITSFSPISGSPGDSITISGSNFTTLQTVQFGGKVCVGLKFINSTTIRAVVGLGNTGSVSVYTSTGNTSLPGFTFVAPPIPSITSVNPIFAPSNSEVVITGVNLGSTPADNIVQFGNARATILESSTTSLRVLVPTHAEYQPVTVTTSYLTAYSPKSFNTTFVGGGAMFQSSFAERVYFPIPGYKQIFIDIDGDGKKDLVCTTPGDKVSVARNQSSGANFSFPNLVSFATGLAPIAVAAGDLDGDGQPDLLTANRADGFASLSVLRNNSMGSSISFVSRKDLPTGKSVYSNPVDVAIRDLDADGRPEIICINTDASLTVYKNASVVDTVMFSNNYNFPVPGVSQDISIDDIDGDGKPDILITSTTNHNIYILRNTSTESNISFAPGVPINIETAPLDIATADMDGDGKPDVVISIPGMAYISVYKNNSSIGTISITDRKDFVVPSAPTNFSVDDIDGDGKPDVAVTTSEVGPAHFVSVLRNNSTPGLISFQVPNKYKADGSSANVSITDVDNDGAPEIITADPIQGVSVYRNRVRASHIADFSPTFGGPGTLVGIKGYNLQNVISVSFGGTLSSSIHVISTDSMTAIVAGGNSGNVLVSAPSGDGNSPGFLFSQSPLINTFFPVSGPIGTEVIITGANFSSTASNNIVYFGPVKSVVKSATANILHVEAPHGASVDPITVTVGGLTGSTNRGFVITFPGSPAAFLPESFASKTDFPGVSIPFGVASGDFNDDGKVDIVVANHGTDNLSVFPNSGSSGAVSFLNKVDLISGWDPSAISIADFDGDGKLDILTSGIPASIFRNTSSGGNISFAPKLELSMIPVGYVSFGDVDRDGKLDIATTSSNKFAILRNTSTIGTISFEANLYDVADGNPRSIFLGDLNGDNRPDVAVGRSSNDIVTVFQNITTGPIAFAPGIDHFIGDGPYEGLIATDIDGDERPDLVASNFNGATVAVLKNISKKDIAFESAVQFPAAANATTVTSGDLDGDSRPDIVSANGNSYTGGNSITLLKNKTEYEVSFAPKLEYTAGTNPNDVLIADLDGDGKPEVIVVSVNTNSVTIFRNKMNEARVVPSGSNPVNGNIVCSITIDPVVQTHNGNPYVQRHYDIQPVNNPALSTATITLFFSQEDFDNYNIHPAHGANLPSGPDDVANKANVRAYQYHGFSASGMPGTYSGNGVEINPDDNNIVWNATAQWWEITFNIDGFSGFFLASAGSSILPLKLISFSGSLNGDNTILKWTTAQEMNVDRFELEHATNGADFTKISTIRAVGNSTIQANYQFTDHPRHNIVDYYRLRMIDQDDKFTYSYVIRVKKNQIENSSVVRIYPNPASSYLIVEHPSTNKTSELRIIDRIGTIVSLTAVGRLSKQTRVELEKLPSGHYQLVWTDGFRKLITTFVKH